MAQYDSPYATAPGETPARSRKWPLAGVMLLDLAVILVLVLVSISLVSAVLIGVRAAQQGMTRDQLGNLSQEQLLRLLGTGGVFVTLLIQNAICVIVPVLRIAVIRREPLAEIGFQAPRPLRLIMIGVGVGALLFGVNVVISLLFSIAGFQQNQAEQLTQQFSVSAGDRPGQLLFLIGGGLLAPIGEEVLFRGYIFNAIRLTFQNRSWGLPLAYMASALVFATIHAPEVTQGAIALVVPLFLVALVLAWAMHYTKSLVPCIIAHAINNGIGLVALLVCLNNPVGCPNL
jgi:uncharacterized protein